jgi:hypothetical protein
MLPNKDILSELSQISPALTNISRNHVYSVPLNYFDGLAGNILQQIKDDIARQTLVSTVNPFSIPEGYFDFLPGAILDKIKQTQVGLNEVPDELGEIAPLLNTISRIMPYQVVPGYFEDFTVNTSRKNVDEQSTAKVIKSGWFSRSYKYAAAAVVAGVAIVSTFLLTPDNNIKNPSATYTSSINIPAAVNKVSEADINEFLINNAVIPEAAVSITGSNNEVDFLQVLENTSEEDIQDYLKQYEGTAVLKGKSS